MHILNTLNARTHIAVVLLSLRGSIDLFRETGLLSAWPATEPVKLITKSPKHTTQVSRRMMAEWQLNVPAVRVTPDNHFTKFDKLSDLQPAHWYSAQGQWVNKNFRLVLYTSVSEEQAKNVKLNPVIGERINFPHQVLVLLNICALNKNNATDLHRTVIITEMRKWKIENNQV